MTELDGIQRIAIERARHPKLGYTLEHDLMHASGELVAAAMCYLVAVDPTILDPAGDYVLQMWPFALEEYQPSEDPSRNLEIAGALIAAELDRDDAARQRQTVAS